MRLRRIGPSRLALCDDGNASDRAWLELLHSEGVAAGKVFITRHGHDIVVRVTLDVSGLYVDSRKPKLQIPASSRRLNVDTAALSHVA